MRKVMGGMAGAALAFVAVSGAHAQSVEGGRAGPRAVMDRATEIALARSAAPPAVSDDATVLVWTGEGFETALHGANGVTCYVARSWPESIEPHCFDEEGSRTMRRSMRSSPRASGPGSSDFRLDPSCRT